MKNLHLINNEKITESMISIFESAYPGTNCFIIFNRGTNYMGDFSKYINVVDEKDAQIFLDTEIKYDNIIIHSLDIRKVRIIEKYIKYSTKIIWLLWGGDIYNRPEFGHKLYKHQTLKALIFSDPKKELIKYLFNWTRSYFGEYKEIRQFAEKINVIGTTLYDDFVLAKEILKINPSFKEFNFYFTNSEKTSEENVGPSIVDKKKINVLVGNSGDPSNNHIEIINKLQYFPKIIDTTFYFILSYGNEKYIKRVIEYGRSKLGTSFVPIDSFMPFVEYSSLLRKIDIAVFGFTRQQGFGNIIQLLKLKKQIYLDSENPIFKYLMNINIEVKSISNLINDVTSKTLPIIDSSADTVSNLFSYERGIILTKNLLR